MAKLTKRTVDAAQPDRAGKRIYLWDEHLHGFGLVVQPTGVKSYCFQYRTAEGRTRRATIGRHGALTPSEARQRAKTMYLAVAEGRDPLEEKRSRRQAKTLGEVFLSYLESEKFKAKAPSTQSIDRGRIKRHLEPLLGHRYVDALRPNDVEKAFANIQNGKTAITVKSGPRGLARVSGGEGTARMAIRLLRAILNWAIREGLASSNAAAEVQVGSDGKRNVILESAEDYRRLLDTLDRMEREKLIRSPVADAIRLIALTGARRSEIASLKWKYVDLATGFLEIPKNAHKTGHKTGDARIIALSGSAIEVISRQPLGGADDFVFAPARGAGPLNLGKPWRSIREQARLPEGIGLHGLRHSLASHLAMNGAEAAEIMTTLGHRQLATAQRYIHWARDQRAALAERAADIVMGGSSSPGRSRTPTGSSDVSANGDPE